MISRSNEQPDVWDALAAPLPQGAQARPGAIRERLDECVAGQWDCTLDLIGSDDDGATFKCRVQILGVIRENVGTAPTYQRAASLAFVRACAMFGMGRPAPAEAEVPREVAREPEVEGEQRGRPTESGAANGDARAAATTPTSARASAGTSTATPAGAAATTTRTATTEDEPTCPKCGGRMWDNRLTKRNPKAPDFKCRDRSCDGCIWPPRNGERAPDAIGVDSQPENVPDDDDLPF